MDEDWVDSLDDGWQELARVDATMIAEAIALLRHTMVSMDPATAYELLEQLVGVFGPDVLVRVICEIDACDLYDAIA